MKKRINENEQERYDISKICQTAVHNIESWVSEEDGKILADEVKYLSKKNADLKEILNFAYDFFDTHIYKFFDILSKRFGVEIEFLEDHKDIILKNISKMILGIDTKEEDEIETIVKKSKEPKSYAEMSPSDLKKEVDKAIDAKDWKKLEQIRPYLKEEFLIVRVQNALNERLKEDNLDESYLLKPLKEWRKSSKK